MLWFHFEGRIPEVSLKCIRYLRDHAAFHGESGPTLTLKISVEVEKPKRLGLRELAHQSDMVFYSKSWAQGEGYRNAREALLEEARLFVADQSTFSRPNHLMTCTEGEKGAWALQLPCADQNMFDSVVFSPGHTDHGRPVADTVGAGDTFNAGMLYALLCRDYTGRRGRWSLEEKLAFANLLAGKKVAQYGFAGLATQVCRELIG